MIKLSRLKSLCRIINEKTTTSIEFRIFIKRLNGQSVQVYCHQHGEKVNLFEIISYKNANFFLEGFYCCLTGGNTITDEILQEVHHENEF